MNNGENKPATGGIPSRADYRDAIASASVPVPISIALPPEFHTPLGDVLMQDKEPACVSFSIAYLLRLYWFRKTGKWIDFSPRFLDILSAEPDIPIDGGRRPRTVLKISASIGCCTMATLPNDTSLPIAKYRDKSAISSAAYAEALKYRIPGYIRLGLDISATRASIYLHGAISALFTIGLELWTPSWADRDIDPLRPPAQIVSGHQMTPCGWRDKNLDIVRNSWSSAWADKGEAGYDPTKWEPYTLEQWAIADIPADTADFLKALPAPADFHYQWNKNLAQGYYNDDVKMAQVAFLILGFMKPFPPDEWGVYGHKTAAAVLSFQIANDISPVSGSDIGPKTRAALNTRFAL